MRHWLFLMVFLAFTACGGPDYVMNPVDRLVKDLRKEHEVFSVILEDMKVEGTFFNAYYHKYRIVTGKGTDVNERMTDWKEVKEKFFWQNERNLGMTLAALNEDGKLQKEAAPPGFHNYVGNSQYGQFVQRNGSSFWQFYGQYRFMTDMLALGGLGIGRNDYRTWQQDYRGRKPYYGSSSGSRTKSKYGTYSNYNRTKRRDFFQRRQRSSGWRKSNYTTSGQKRSSGIRRSSGRYSRGSGGFRSRGGGFGK